MQGEIQQEQWQAYLDGFSKRNSGRMADLQILSDELGTQEEAEMLPFEGITLDNEGITCFECRDHAGRNWISRQAQPNSYCYPGTTDRAKDGRGRTRRRTRNRSQRRRKNHPNLQDAAGATRNRSVKIIASSQLKKRRRH